ncbi:AAA family ATPase, partial [Candidatus Poribacteria bacterium]|nr:AAA family ATPase [Candidatus Poribacteria bacterium]
EIYLAYDYGNGVLIEIDLKDGYVNPNFNKEFKDGFSAIIREARAFNQYADRQNVSFLSSSEILAREDERKTFVEEIKNLASDLFNDDKDLIFIPAGRSLLATLSDQLQNIHPHQLDYPMRAFVERINNLKPLFSKSFDELITDKKKLTYERVDSENLSLARQIIGDILKARYRFDREGDKLFIDDSERYVKLNYASSGQQESIWILLLIFLLILDNQDVFIVFEEPEAHLYPEAQKEVIDLIALLANLRQNQIMITTHSPYILSSFNNLIYAHLLGQTKPKQVSRLVDRRLWIHPSRIGTFMIEKGMITNIVDEDVPLIKTEAIDSASEQLNSIFDELFNLDDE